MNTFNEIAADGINRVYFNRGTNADIMKVFFAEYDKAMLQGAKLAPLFQKKTFSGSCEAVWDFVKYGIKYEVDPEGTQTIQLPSHLLNVSKKGDCKSKTLLCAAIISNFNFNGYRPTVTIRFVNYENITAYTHVYMVASLLKEFIIIDTVWNKFNSEKMYHSKKDFIMKINSISGFSEAYTENIEGKRAKTRRAERKEKKAAKKASGKGIVNKAKNVVNKGKETVKRTVNKGKEVVKKGGKGLFQGAAKVYLLVPRGSFLALVRLNARGLANKLFNAPKEKAEKIWKALGGNPAKLYAAVAVGHKKKPFLGEKASVQTTEGIGEPVTVVTISTLLASAGAILAAFAPLLKMVDKNKGTKGGESTEELLKEADGAGADLTIPDGEVADGEEGSGKKSSGNSMFDVDIDFKDPKVLLVGAGLAYGAYRLLK